MPFLLRGQFANSLFELAGETDFFGRFGRQSEVANLDGEPLARRRSGAV